MQNKIKRFSSGFSQIPIILGLVLMLIALPFIAKLSQNSQDNRSKAAEEQFCTGAYGARYTTDACVSGERELFTYQGFRCCVGNDPSHPTNTPAPVGTCSSAGGTCGMVPCSSMNKEQLSGTCSYSMQYCCGADYTNTSPECASNSNYRVCDGTGAVKMCLSGRLISVNCAAGLRCSGTSNMCEAVAAPTPTLEPTTINGNCSNAFRLSCQPPKIYEEINLFQCKCTTPIGPQAPTPTPQIQGACTTLTCSPPLTRVAVYNNYCVCQLPAPTATPAATGACSGHCSPTSCGLYGTASGSCLGSPLGPNCCNNGPPTSTPVISCFEACLRSGYSEIQCGARCTAPTSTPAPTATPMPATIGPCGTLRCATNPVQIGDGLCRCNNPIVPTPTPRTDTEYGTCILIAPSCVAPRTLVHDDGANCHCSMPGAPTNTPVPVSSCYCIYNCTPGTCRYATSASTPYNNSCGASACAGLPTSTPIPIATLRPLLTSTPRPVATNTPAPLVGGRCPAGNAGQPGETCADSSKCDIAGGCNPACGSGSSGSIICDVPNGYCRTGTSCRQRTTGYHLTCVNNACVNQLCPNGAVSCDNNCTACGYAAPTGPGPTGIQGGTNPTATPGAGNPNPTSPPDGGSCPYSNLQARVQAVAGQPLSQSITITSGAQAGITCTYNATGTLASNVKLIATHNTNSAYNKTWNLSNESGWIPEVGVFTVKCQSTDSRCNNLTSDTSTVTVNASTSASCKQCPATFVCFGNPSYGYKWFAPGYQDTGYTQAVSQYCISAGLSQPTFKGKERGDANCDGVINGADYSIWRKEYLDVSGGNNVTRSTWEADFTGNGGRCDGVVNGNDYSLWRSNYLN